MIELTPTDEIDPVDGPRHPHTHDREYEKTLAVMIRDRGVEVDGMIGEYGEILVVTIRDRGVGVGEVIAIVTPIDLLVVVEEDDPVLAKDLGEAIAVDEAEVDHR